jgi:hypothetical protein
MTLNLTGQCCGLLRIGTVLAQRLIQHGSSLSIYRWLVEWTLTWGSGFAMIAGQTFMEPSFPSAVGSSALDGRLHLATPWSAAKAHQRLVL